MTFEESWPELSRRLTRFLVARRVPEAQLDDLLQETAIRLFRAWDRVDPIQGPWRLARTIAVHAIADATLSERRYATAELEELPDVTDAERAAIARARLSSVGRALTRMSTIDRQVLLAEVGAAPSPALGRSALKMARSRARRRLELLVKKPGQWVGFPRLLRWPLDHARRLLDSRSPFVAQLADGAAAGLVALAVSGAALTAGPPAAGAGSVAGDAGRMGGTTGDLRSWFETGRGTTAPADGRDDPVDGRARAGDVVPTGPGVHDGDQRPSGPPPDDVDNVRAGAKQEAHTLKGQAEFLRDGAEREAETARGQGDHVRGDAEREAGNAKGNGDHLRSDAEREAGNAKGNGDHVRDDAEREARNLTGG